MADEADPAEGHSPDDEFRDSVGDGDADADADGGRRPSAGEGRRSRSPGGRRQRPRGSGSSTATGDKPRLSLMGSFQGQRCGSRPRPALTHD